MIDYIAKWADRATALADAILLAHTALDDQGVRQFLLDHASVITVWRNSQDVSGTDAQGNPTITHTPLAGFFVLISLNNIVPALRDHAAIQLVIDSEKARLRQAGMVIRSTVGGVILQDIRLQPIFAGRDYPFGVLN